VGFSINTVLFFPSPHFFSQLSLQIKSLQNHKNLLSSLLTESHSTSFISLCYKYTSLLLESYHTSIFTVESRRSTSFITWFLLQKHRNTLWRLFTGCYTPIESFSQTCVFYKSLFGFPNSDFSSRSHFTLFLSIDITKG
jgi:hypothetical protein